MGGMKRLHRLASVPLALLFLLAAMTPTLALDRQRRLEVMAGVVQIAWVNEERGRLYGLMVGSGTIVSSDGLILTNAHVAAPHLLGEDADFDHLGVYLTIRSDQPPTPAYLGQVVQADGYLDLAVIRITHNLDGTPVDPEELNLPYVELGDSSAIEVGDGLNIFGYPAIGEETITFTRGVISGFTLDASIEGRAWIKTDASISGGNSGGTAVDEDGRLVGIPTRGLDVDCRVTKDTNRDGRIDEDDTCIPVGGFINALRPINLAIPLIEAARLGLDAPVQEVGAGDKAQPTSQPRLSNLFFSPGVTDFDQPTSVIRGLPVGARSLYLFFDYENMSSANSAELEVWINGREAPGWGWQTGSWAGGESGTWWLGWDDADFETGTWDLELYVDGRQMTGAEIEIGVSAPSAPSFSNLVLSLEQTDRNEPVEPSVLFPAGTRDLYASFDYEGMRDGLDWTRTWLVDGEVGLTKTESWDADRAGSYSLQLSSQRGLEAGAYRLKLYLEGELAVMSNFWVTGSRGSGASFDPITFAEGIDQRGDPVRAAHTFASGLEELHAFTTYSGMEDGLDYVVNWYIDGEKVVEQPSEWDGGESGPWHYRLYSTSGALPDGQYDVKLIIEGQVLQSGSTTIGVGSSATQVPAPGPTDGVGVQGTITDMDTGRPIPGALFLVLKPGITVAAFQWTEDELYTAAEADRRGWYELPELLERGQCYSMMILAEGYWSYNEDDVCVSDTSASLVDLDLELEKQ
jgi:hypothetical protein